MWITIKINNEEISLNDFLEKLPSKESILDLIQEVQDIKDNWDTIKIQFDNDSKNRSEEDVMIRQI